MVIKIIDYCYYYVVIDVAKNLLSGWSPCVTFCVSQLCKTTIKTRGRLFVCLELGGRKIEGFFHIINSESYCNYCCCYGMFCGSFLFPTSLFNIFLRRH